MTPRPTRSPIQAGTLRRLVPGSLGADFCAVLSAVLCALVLAGCSSGSGDPPGFEQCPEVRPEICTQQYDPVCATLDDGSRASYGNGCTACSDARVRGYVAGACPDA
jgi:hypothetical protein